MPDSELRAKMRRWLEREGFREGSYGSCQHTTGLPSIPDAIRVAPEYAAEGIASVIIVTGSTVQRYCIHTPFNYHEWMPYARETHYETLEELRQTLNEMVRPPASAWEDEE